MKRNGSHGVPVLYAHSANGAGVRHLLSDHLRSVAALAERFSGLFGGEDISFLAGLWHDVGKAHPQWQRLLFDCEKGRRKRVGKDHKAAGALLARQHDQMGGVVGLLVHGHHGGLTDPTSFRGWLQNQTQSPDAAEAVRVLEPHLPELVTRRSVSIPNGIVDDPLETELFLRMCYSALVDADSLDTEQHVAGNVRPVRGSSVTLTELWSRYEAFLGTQPTPAPGVVNRVRGEVYDSCLRAAGSPSGLFRLTVPTGGGKTRSGLAFALRHGMNHGMRRVIVAVPFLTITEQTVGVYRSIFENGYHDQTVLEHHSNTDPVGDDDGETFEDVWRRLTAENWDAPIVVTTTVQLFESLMSNKRSAVRKLHNIANSVIILDEAQALPQGLLSPILGVLSQLIDRYGVTVVLSTATQPVFEQISQFRSLAPREIVSDHRRHFEMLKDRVSYEWQVDRPLEWSAVADWMRAECQVLTIVNTKRHAMELLDELGGDPSVLHLSTLMCAAHRRHTVDTIRQLLGSGLPCRVVSTQVVEAGVDVDFPVVFRSEAPLDAIVQAAGRCNREGKMDTPGRTVVFSPPDDAIPPGVYRSGRDVGQVLRALHGNLDLNDPRTVEEYFDMLFGLAVSPDRHDINKLRKQLDYPKVAERFRMIPDDTYDVAVAYPQEVASSVDHMLDNLRHARGSGRHIRRQLQPHIVSIRRFEVQQLQKRGLITEIASGLGRWNGRYDSVRGIEATDPETII